MELPTFQKTEQDETPLALDLRLSEGDRLSEPDGIRATKKLIETIRTEYSAAK